LTGDFKLRNNSGEYTYSPTDIGKTRLDPDDLKGGDTIEAAAKIFVDILNGNGTAAQTDVITANAGIAINCIKPNQTLEESIAEASESLLSGNALEKFKNLIN